MSPAALFACDIVAIALLVFAIYFPRHRHREMVVALVGINVGVLGVTQALASAEISAGLGLGLFGVLSIIRLRSAEMDQAQVAYYFSALALGLLGGVTVSPAWLTPVLMAAILAGVLVADHPALFGRYRQQTMNLDRAYTDEDALVGRLEQMLGAKVHRVDVRRVDLVNDTTTVDVRFQRPAVASSGPSDAAATAEFGVGR